MSNLADSGCVFPTGSTERIAEKSIKRAFHLNEPSTIPMKNLCYPLTCTTRGRGQRGRGGERYRERAREREGEREEEERGRTGGDQAVAIISTLFFVI